MGRNSYTDRSNMAINVVENWRNAVIIAIRTKGDKLHCRSYREIPPLNVCDKVLTTIL
jgi:23S rRNA G2445 N2-methylase RlmL